VTSCRLCTICRIVVWVCQSVGAQFPPGWKPLHSKLVNVFWFSLSDAHCSSNNQIVSVVFKSRLERSKRRGCVHKLNISVECYRLNAMSCSLVDVHRHFRGTYWLNLHDRRIGQASDQQETGGRQICTFLPGHIPTPSKPTELASFYLKPPNVQTAFSVL
jgi:hypothetical protein